MRRSTRVRVIDGLIQINGEPLSVQATDKTDPIRLEEKVGEVKHLIQRLPHLPDRMPRDFVIQEDQYFFMGDNRDNSSDGRVWGFVPKQDLVGKALVVWFSKWDRVGKTL